MHRNDHEYVSLFQELSRSTPHNKLKKKNVGHIENLIKEALPSNSGFHRYPILNSILICLDQNKGVRRSLANCKSQI